MAKATIPEEELMLSGHVGCLGCGATLTMRYVLKALGKNTVISVPACCWAVMPGPYPLRCLEIPMLYNAFETTGASISGLRAAYDMKGRPDINVLGFAGDGGTADIGIQSLSGAVERGDNVFYVMYDNEAYMNTGVQRSSSTPYGAWTTTTPGGTTGDWKRQPKKNMMEIMVAHRIPYAATASVAYPEDMVKKLRKGIDVRGPKFYHIYAPCPTGWRLSPDKTIEISKLATDSCIFPIYEVENGIYTINRKPAKKVPVRDYLRLQGRFRHLGEEELNRIQEAVDWDWKLLLRKEEFMKDM
ncbi:MAG: 3-methyl-2-oxobutanoate dehydrogenase subunit beta [Euryarchaeota archaeon]|nr:3-methyl-2-oxobutanoate dehydrogenase subunit beta [Euryarchaeota archaeon]